MSANLALDRGLTLCDGGDVGAGLLWFARGLELAPQDEEPLRAVLQANLAAWRGQLSTLREWLVHDSAVRAVAISPDGRNVLTGTQFDEAVGLAAGLGCERLAITTTLLALAVLILLPHVPSGPP